MRVGPSRLISTAESSGESNDTVAAEWMTTSQDGEHGAVGVGEPEAVGADVAGDRRDAPRRHLVERSAPQLGAETVERVVLEQIPVGPARAAGVRLPSPDQQHEVAVGHAAQQPLDERRPHEAGGAGDGDAFPGERLGDHDPHV